MLTDVPRMFRYAVLIVLWALFFVMIYKVLTLEKDYIEYDPFEILQIDPVSSNYLASSPGTPIFSMLARKRSGCLETRLATAIIMTLCANFNK